MIDPSKHLDKEWSLTTKMIIKECLSRNWKVEAYYIGSKQLRLHRPDGHVLELYGAISPVNTYTAAATANNKYISHLLFKENDLPSPDTWLIRDITELAPVVTELIAHHQAFVVKPLDSSHGNGVTVDLTTHDAAILAFSEAQRFSHIVIVQVQSANRIDIRIAIVNFKHVATLIRVPARVTGDGTSTVSELILKENLRPNRGKNYRKELNQIDLVRAEQYLGNKIDTVPAKGEIVTVVGTANVGTGGETVDVTDDIPRWLIDMAEKTAKVLRLPVCGVDFLIKQKPATGHTIEDLSPVLIEINKSPALFIHETPTFGKPRGIIKVYVDYLENL